MTVVVATHQETLIKLADIHISLNKKAAIHEGNIGLFTSAHKHLEINVVLLDLKNT